MTYANDRNVQNRTHDALADRLKRGIIALREAPLLAVLILTGLIVVAVFADVIAPMIRHCQCRGEVLRSALLDGGGAHTPWARTFRPAMC